jgi:hypothetical protein
MIAGDGAVVAADALPPRTVYPPIRRLKFRPKLINCFGGMELGLTIENEICRKKGLYSQRSLSSEQGALQASTGESRAGYEPKTAPFISE